MATHLVSRSVVIDAPAQTIFDILAAPHRHSEFDGSGSVKGLVEGPERLTRGARFGMDMVLGLPYRISNRVVEFEEGRRIAWRHAGPHRWRWELAPFGDGATRVTETFDYTRAPRGVYQLLGIPARNARGIERTLPRLKRLAETG
ncbi:polyketide cyclase/dehydrase/lipid transport protein [Murinocardiopsis flavida]|uniref:Polyketide cyclase/dehydrase/lipid transport protein n=1 Tax=Murinocardiopsis flavida TaxID=645275 RepID=A0A2P8DMW7_9ACTN|nr:SRPBCC family protein [Murinocardiopsis flavida]PSK98557.1 polyketide cyclase/dehydrase/lipid transport protein [Murinocardiopsis flavida]